MGKWFSRNFKTIIYISFLVPIITVAIVSISHVTQWYGISNPLSWAVYLSIGIEIAALSALAAISAQMGSKVYFPFGIVTLIQFVGNIFFAFEYIKIDSQQFLSWVELTGPILEYTGIEQGDLQSHRRFLAIFAGGMLPLISLSFLHMLVKFNEENRKKSVEEPVQNDVQEPVQEENKVEASDLVAEISRYRPTEDDLKNLEDILTKFKPEEPKKRITKEEQRELLQQMVRESEEMGLYDEPFDNPLIKKDETPEPPSWMDDIPEPTEEDYGDWDATLEDGLENDVWDEDHGLDQVLNDMVEDLPEEEIVETTQEIKNIDVVLDQLPTPQNIDFKVDTVVTTPELTKKVPNKYEGIQEYLDYTRGYDQTKTEEELVGEVGVENDTITVTNTEDEVPTPTINPNFVVREPIQDQEDPEKKN